MSKKTVVLVAILMLVGGWAGAYTMLKKSSPKQEVKFDARIDREIETIELPEFTINLADTNRQHYLKTTIALAVIGEGKEISEKVKKVTPYIRDAMVIELSRQNYQVLLTELGKKKLRLQLAECAKRHLVKEDIRLDKILFTSFVMD
jgi:flagellar basal body-associated protein FliL